MWHCQVFIQKNSYFKQWQLVGVIIKRFVFVQLEPDEEISVLDIIDTDNKVLNKVLIVFSTLCLEVRSLEQELATQYLEQILYYGEGSEYNL